MAQAKVVPVKGTKFFVQSGLGTPVAPTLVTKANPGVVTVTLSPAAAKGDVIVISGLGYRDGAYVVASVAVDEYTLAGADWSGIDVPASYTGSTVAKVTFGDNFCDIKSFSRSGGTVDQNEITNICSEGKEFESGLYDGGTLGLTFNYYPDATVQAKLSDYEDSGDKFWTRWELPRVNTVLLHYGSIQTGANIDGSVGGNYESGVTIKISGRPTRVNTGA